jgi:phage/plasmid-like protein (TIGR03299 family)
MAHKIENNEMMYVGATPWHGLGVKLNDNPSIEDAIKAAGLDWEVQLMPLYLADGRKVSRQASVRTDKNLILGDVGPGYHVLQNHDAFQWFQPFLESGAATLETAGALESGKRIWIQAKIKADPIEIVKNDPVEQYVLLAHAHDGTLAIRCGFTAQRVVCYNTLSMAVNRSDSQLIRVRHTSAMLDNLEKIQEVMDLSRQEFIASCEQYKLLASRQISKADLEKYVKTVFELPETQKRESKVLTSVVSMFEHGKGNNMPGVAGTVWAAYNAVTEYMTWEQGRTADARLNKLWFGQNVKTNREALEVAVELAKAA